MFASAVQNKSSAVQNGHMKYVMRPERKVQKSEKKATAQENKAQDHSPNELCSSPGAPARASSTSIRPV
ncbi:hypothetical protein ON010_g11 [Phytophthora cinnamomi]|nr:hypothetical protein ON010_g11 [Phytophthora cinnamomi]